MSRRQPATGERYAPHNRVLQRLCDGDSSPQVAAEEMAFIARIDEDIETGVQLLWHFVIYTAREAPERQEKLVSLMVCLSQLGQDGQGAKDNIEGGNVWDLMFLLGMDMNGEWNSKSKPIFTKRTCYFSLVLNRDGESY